MVTPGSRRNMGHNDMKLIFPLIMYTSSVLAVCMMLQYLVLREKHYLEDKFFMVMCIGSAVWSFGFAALFMQESAEDAFLCRAFGMAGTFVYMISTQIFISQMAEIPKKWKYAVNGFSFAAIPLYVLMTRPGLVIFSPTPIGMSYHFRQGVVYNLYTAYSLIVALNILVVVLYMLRNSKKKRHVVFARRFLFLLVFVFAGTVLDTIFPMLGLPAIPGSSITQFWGLVGGYCALRGIRRSRINLNNMSEFIYYSVSAPVLVCDAVGRLQIINDAGVAFFRLDREALHNMRWVNQLFRVNGDEIFLEDVLYQELDAVCKRNQKYCSLAVNTIKDVYGDVIGYIIMVTDQTERIQSLNELEEAKHLADAANNAKSTFLANMSHEIRTPMNAIVGFSELALQEELTPEVREYVLDIRGASHSLLAIINDILDISKIESGKMELVCSDYFTKTLLNDVFLIIDGQAKKKGLEFKMSVSEDMPKKLFGDKVRIREVLINLLNNSVKYTERGSISLDARVESRMEDVVKLKFSVQDTGIGIRQEDQKELFESFTQVDKVVNNGKEGTGLGLAIVKGFVELMDGEVSVESEYGKGSLFTVVIQQNVLDDGKIGAGYSDARQVEGDTGIGKIKLKNVRALVVDDNMMNLKMAKRGLEHYGIDADIAGSGKLAIEMCRENQYQLVLMDQMMPGMDGIEAMREIRKLDYYAPGGVPKIIILTANTMSGMRNQMIEEGFDEFLGKPLNFKHLERLLRRFVPDSIVREKKV